MFLLKVEGAYVVLGLAVFAAKCMATLALGASQDRLLLAFQKVACLHRISLLSARPYKRANSLRSVFVGLIQWHRRSR